MLAGRGIGSRRACDTLIESGVVRVNGAVVREPGRRVEPERDRVMVRGRPLPGRSALRYFLIHKPVGMITTLHDPEGRATVRDLLPPGPRLFPVGRLDADTSGLLLVTNDGELAHKLMHPRYGVEKRYRVLVDEVPDSAQLRRMREGVTLEPGVRTGPADVRLARSQRERPMVDIRIHEGRYRQVRRMCEAVGLGVKALHRYGYGPLQIGTLPRGALRPLSEGEVRKLKAMAARPGGVAPRRFHGPAPSGERSRPPVPKRPRRERTFEQPRREHPSARPRGGRTSDRPRGERTFDRPRAGRTSARPRREPTFDQPRRGRTSDRPRGERTFERPRRERTFDRPRGERTFDQPRRGRTSDRARGERTFEQPRRGRTSDRARGERTFEQPRRGRTSDRPRGERTFERPRRGRTSDRPGGGRTFDRPRGERQPRSKRGRPMGQRAGRPGSGGSPRRPGGPRRPRAGRG
ncbi:MAG TPA: pseudouridine synthase [Candidatus Eisenbacteria bacterium]|nr:pseudouridine synthase [Candidatus Eisenbacteria bacterium]